MRVCRAQHHPRCTVPARMDVRLYIPAFLVPQTRLTMASPLSRSSIVTHGRIDEINILQATMEGMRQSVEALHCEC